MDKVEWQDVKVGDVVLYPSGANDKLYLIKKIDFANEIVMELLGNQKPTSTDNIIFVAPNTGAVIKVEGNIIICLHYRYEKVKLVNPEVEYCMFSNKEFDKFMEYMTTMEVTPSEELKDVMRNTAYVRITMHNYMDRYLSIRSYERIPIKLEYELKEVKMDYTYTVVSLENTDLRKWKSLKIKGSHLDRIIIDQFNNRRDIKLLVDQYSLNEEVVTGYVIH